jgi:hypothetical protein
MIPHAFRKKTGTRPVSKNDIPPAAMAAEDDPRPVPLRRDVRLACEGVTVVALSISVELNVYDHVKHAHMPGILGWTIGIAVPVVVAMLSHVAAHVNFHWAVKIWVGGIVSLLMYVSAFAGTRVLTPGMTKGPALGTAAGMDLAALTALGLLMFNASVEAALAAWGARDAARRQAAESQKIVDRYSRTERTVTAPGNAVGNAVPAVTGNARAAEVTVTAPNPVAPAGAPETVTIDDTEALGGAPGAEVIDLRPVPTEEEMRVLARALYEETGRLSVRAYRDQHRGSQKKVAAAVAAVKAELGLTDDDDAARDGRGEAGAG